MSDIVSKKINFSTPFLQGYKELRIPIFDSNGNPAWPELFSSSKIEILRNTVGARHFSAQMLLEYVPMDRARLDPDALSFYSDDFDVRTAKLGDVFITAASVYWDPSSGRRKSDGSVCVLLYRDDKNRHMYIHDALYLIVSDEELHPLARQCDMVLDFLQRHNLRRIVIETNGIGNALPEIMREVARRRSFNIVIEKISNHTKKEIRILDAIEPVLTSARLHAHRRIQSTPLIAEMLGWAPLGSASHDDGLDALAGAISAQAVPLRALGRSVQTFSANTNFKL